MYYLPMEIDVAVKIVVFGALFLAMALYYYLYR
jgi:hypothetical protein